MAYTDTALTLGLLSFGLADTFAAQQGNCSQAVSSTVKIGQLTTSELSFFSFSFDSTADGTGHNCLGTFRLTVGGQECVIRLTRIYRADAPGIEQDNLNVNETLTALNGVGLIAPIVIRMSSHAGDIVLDEIDGLQIQFNWKYKKMSDRVRIVGELIRSVDGQLKALCS